MPYDYDDYDDDEDLNDDDYDYEGYDDQTFDGCTCSHDPDDHGWPGEQFGCYISGCKCNGGWSDT